MIIEEYFEINGISHVRHYSDSGVMVSSDDGMNNGVEYEVAEDLASLGKVYHETTIPIREETS